MTQTQISCIHSHITLISHCYYCLCGCLSLIHCTVNFYHQKIIESGYSLLLLSPRNSNLSTLYLRFYFILDLKRKTMKSSIFLPPTPISFLLFSAKFKMRFNPYNRFMYLAVLSSVRTGYIPGCRSGFNQGFK